MSYSSVTLARRITIIGCCVVWVTLAAIGWQRTFQSTTLEASLTQTPEKAERALYVPSPLEVKLLSVEGGPWPRRFNSAHPPTPERLPELYSEAEASGLAAALASPTAWRKARAWTVSANSGDLKRLEAELTTIPEPQRRLSARGSATCTIDEQEALFRWQQVKPALRSDFANYLERCGGSSVIADLTRLMKAIEARDHAALESLETRFTARSHVPDKSWEAWISGEAAQAARLALGGI